MIQLHAHHFITLGNMSNIPTETVEYQINAAVVAGTIMDFYENMNQLGVRVSDVNNFVKKIENGSPDSTIVPILQDISQRDLRSTEIVNHIMEAANAYDGVPSSLRLTIGNSISANIEGKIQAVIKGDTNSFKTIASYVNSKLTKGFELVFSTESLALWISSFNEAYTPEEIEKKIKSNSDLKFMSSSFTQNNTVNDVKSVRESNPEADKYLAELNVKNVSVHNGMSSQDSIDARTPVMAFISRSYMEARMPPSVESTARETLQTTTDGNVKDNQSQPTQKKTGAVNSFLKTIGFIK